MTGDPQDPPRLRDDPAIAEALREGLEQMEAVAMPDATRERLARNLGLGPATPSGGGTPGGSTPLALKASLLLGGAIGVAAAIVFWATRPPPTAIDRAPAPRSSIDPRPVVEALPSATIEVETPSPALVTPSRSVVAPIAPPVARTTPDEATLFRKAGAALRDGDAQNALQLVDEQARLFPNGTFAQEREVLRIDALVALGKTDQARERARTFLAQHPESAHRPRLERMLAQ